MKSPENSNGVEAIASTLYCDITSGQILLGEAALEKHFDSGGHPFNVYPLAEALTNPLIQLPESENASGSFHRVSKEECFAIGKFVQGLISPRKLTGTIMDKGHQIDLTPSAKQIQTVAGHLSLRIRTTRPGQQYENSDDLVITYTAANTDQDTTIDIIKKGLTGKYKISTEVATLADTEFEYNFNENREIRRFKLILSPEEQVRLLSIIYTNQKNFSSNYLFLTNGVLRNIK